jgi:MFS superfamily sulfate permease-like transporter
LSFGLVASAETLLSTTATDRMHQGLRARYDKELLAQGVGNVLCGLASALPITGVIVRSSANIDAGARSRWSAVMHGTWILLLVGLFPWTLEAVPKSCLGAILVYTGYKLANPRAAMALLAYGKAELAIYLVTMATIVATDLLTGVAIGFGLSVARLLYLFSHLAVDVRVDQQMNRAWLKLAGAATFLRLPRLAQTLEQMPAACELHVDTAAVDYIDHACLDLLINWQRQHQGMGGKLVIDWGDLHAKFRGERRPSVQRQPAGEMLAA